jgi:FtsH-binding integral membrane protein
MSALSWMMLLAVLNIFTGSRLLYQVHVYLGLAVMCGFVLFDTQAIVEKRRQGSDDFVTHTLDLFIDFLAIFRRLLVILSDNAKKEKRRN